MAFEKKFFFGKGQQLTLGSKNDKFLVDGRNKCHNEGGGVWFYRQLAKSSAPRGATRKMIRWEIHQRRNGRKR